MASVYDCGHTSIGEYYLVLLLCSIIQDEVSILFMVDGHKHFIYISYHKPYLVIVLSFASNSLVSKF